MCLVLFAVTVHILFFLCICFYFICLPDTVLKVNYCHSWPICSLLDHVLRVHFLKYFTIQFLTFYLKYFKFLLNSFQWYIYIYIATCLTWHPCLNTYFLSGWILTLVFFMIIIILSHFILECVILLETVTVNGFANTWPIDSGLYKIFLKRASWVIIWHLRPPRPLWKSFPSGQ